MQKVRLDELVGGALQEKFGKAFERVVENLQDVNTPYKNKRRITITLDFTQNEKRDDVHVGIHVVEKLAPQAPTETAFAIGKNLKTGELYAKEYGKQVHGQMQMDMPETTAPVVDAETGEVLQPAPVIDLRNAMRQ